MENNLEFHLNTNHIRFSLFLETLEHADDCGYDLLGIHEFQVNYPNIEDKVSPEEICIDEGIYIEISPIKQLYMSTGGQVILPSEKGGSFQTNFHHNMLTQDIKESLTAYTEQILALEKFFSFGG